MLDQFRSPQSVAYTVLLLATVATLGLALGGLRVRGFGLGISGVLLAGIFIGHFGFTIEPGCLRSRATSG